MFTEDEVRRWVEYDYAEVDDQGHMTLYRTIVVGGVDDTGIFGVVLGEGPAEGEIWYMKEHDDEG